MDFGIAGKKALVLGGSGGLGFASARALASEGVNLTLSGRDQGRLDLAKAAIENETGGSVGTVVADLTDTNFANDIFDRVTADGKGIDILVNNCGGPPAGAISAVEADTWRQFFDSMFVAQTTLTAKAIGPMKRSGWGRIISITSSGVIQPIGHLGISNAVRSALNAWSKTVSLELASHGITVNCVVPGRIDTDRVRSLDAGVSQKTGQTIEQVAEASKARIPAGRYGNPSEFGDAVAFLASARAGYITGSSLRIDGGMILSL